MPLILSDEQQMLAEAADGFLNEHAPIAHLRKLRDSRDPDGVSRDLWRSFGEMGFSGVLIPEDQGGSGLGAVEAGVVAEALGRTLTPSPFLSSGVLAAAALKAGSGEQQAAWLPRVAAGEAIVALAVDEAGKHAPHRIRTTAERSGDGFKLNGNNGFVLDGHVADRGGPRSRASDVRSAHSVFPPRNLAGGGRNVHLHPDREGRVAGRPVGRRPV